MGRDKSIDAKKTSIALNYYYNEAKRKGLLDNILTEGQFKEDAIRTAIARGRISNKMISAFCVVMGIDTKELTGESELTGNRQIEGNKPCGIANYEEDINYDEILKAIQLITETQKIRPNEERKRVLIEINEILKRSNW